MWSKTFPKKPGFYWCYGRWTTPNSSARLVVVEVKPLKHGGLNFVGMGQFLYPKEWKGLWKPLKSVELPEGEDLKFLED